MPKSTRWLLALLILILFCFGPSQVQGQRYFGSPNRYYVPNRPQFNPYQNRFQQYRQQSYPGQYQPPRQVIINQAPTAPSQGVPNQLPTNFQPSQKRTLPASQLGFDDLPPGSMVTITPFTAEQKRESAERDRQRQIRAEKRQAEIRSAGENKSLYPRLVGEFEKQRAIVLSVSDWQPHHFGVFKQIVEKTRGHANLIVLFNSKNMYDDKTQIVEVIKALAKDGVDYPHLHFMHNELDTIWLRDFGPQFAENQDGSAVAVDFYYDGMRPQDDALPEDWSKFSGTEFNHVPWTLQGGNLLSNGNGLSITTSQIFRDNHVNLGASGSSAINEGREFIKQQFQKFCNIKELAVLQPLENESTRHVDMFGTFLASDLFLMAKLDPRNDPRNAQILDANAARLAKLKVNGKPLRVERIQVPPRRGKHWSPYTNVILTDRIVLIPILDSDPRGYQEQAIRVYKRLLPNHHVDTINFSTMGKLEGSLHCLSCNVPSFAKLPNNILSFKDALEGAEFEKPVERIRPKTSPLRPNREEIVSTPVIVRKEPVIKEPVIKEPVIKEPVAKELVTKEPTLLSDADPIVEKPISKPPKAQPQPEPESQSREQKIAQARIAVQTYRRTFGTKTGRQEFDCFAIGVDEKSVSLVTVREKRQLTITLSFLDDDDLTWIVANKDQINRYGPRVLDFVKNYDLKE